MFIPNRACRRRKKDPPQLLARPALSSAGCPLQMDVHPRECRMIRFCSVLGASAFGRWVVTFDLCCLHQGLALLADARGLVLKSSVVRRRGRAVLSRLPQLPPGPTRVSARRRWGTRDERRPAGRVARGERLSTFGNIHTTLVPRLPSPDVAASASCAILNVCVAGLKSDGTLVECSQSPWS